MIYLSHADKSFFQQVIIQRFVCLLLNDEQWVFFLKSVPIDDRREIKPMGNCVVNDIFINNGTYIYFKIYLMPTKVFSASYYILKAKSNFTLFWYM